MQLDGCPTYVSYNIDSFQKDFQHMKFTDSEKAREHFDGINVTDVDRLINIPFRRLSPSLMIYNKAGYKCSACKKTISAEYHDYKFCPWCGAIFMRESYFDRHGYLVEEAHAYEVPNVEDGGLSELRAIRDKYKDRTDKLSEDLRRKISNLFKEALNEVMEDYTKWVMKQ